MRPRSNCATHGERKVIGYDTTETLVYEPPKLYVLVQALPEVCLRGPSRLRRGLSAASDFAGRRRSLRHQRRGGGGRCQVVPAPADLPAPGHLRRQRLDAQPLDAAEPGGPGRFRDHAAGGIHDPPRAAGRGRGHRRHELPHAPAQGSAAGHSRRSEEPASGGEDRRDAGQGRLESAGQDVGLHGALLGAVQHLRLPRVAAPGRAGRLLPRTAAALCKEIVSRAT